MKRGGITSNPIAYAVLAVVLFFSANVISNLTLTKYAVDFTEGGLFSLSEGSYKIIQESKEPITFRFFYSNKLASGYPAVKAYASRIVAMLEEYQSASQGRIKVQVIDPEPLSDDEDLAISYGLKGAPVDAEGTKIYFGLVATNSVDQSKLVPIFSFDRERFIEYDLSRMVYDLSTPKKPKIAVMTDLSIDAPSFFGVPGLGGGKSWIILEQLRQLFDVVPMKEDDKEVVKDTNVLMVAQPKKITEEALYAIDQYLLKGGTAVIMLDPNAENNGGTSPDDAAFNPIFNRLLNAWGVNVDQTKIVADRFAARKVVAPQSENGDYNPDKNIDYIAWISMRDQNINHEDITTATLKTVNLGTAGAITQMNNVGLTFEPLITSNEQAQLIDASRVKGTPDPKKLLEDFVPDNKKYVLAAHISGKAKSAFPQHSADAGYVGEGDINVILVADTDLMRDEIWAKSQDFQGYRIVVPNADNADFVINAIDFLGGSKELISLRGRSTTTRPFTVVENLKHDAEERYLAKETELKNRLADTEHKLADMQKRGQEGGAQSAMIYQAQQQSEIRQFTDDMMKIKKELRGVQSELRKGIENLGTFLKFINIGLMPLLVVFFAMGVSWYKSRRRLTK